MFPPVAPEVFDNNPQFKFLYTELTTKILNSNDESSREPAESGAEAVQLLEQVQS